MAKKKDSYDYCLYNKLVDLMTEESFHSVIFQQHQVETDSLKPA